MIVSGSGLVYNSVTESFSGTISSVTFSNRNDAGGYEKHYTLTGLSLTLAQMMTDPNGMIAVLHAGADILYGTEQPDVLTGFGGAGNDQIHTGAGADTVFDFCTGVDRIDMRWLSLGVDYVRDCSVQTSQGALIDLGTSTILLAGVQMSSIDWSHDFLF